MAKCEICGKSNAEYIYSDEGYICESCSGNRFICTTCGVVFPSNESDSGDGTTCFGCINKD